MGGGKWKQNMNFEIRRWKALPALIKQITRMQHVPLKIFSKEDKKLSWKEETGRQ